ncbi:protein ELC-like [Phoenix dactylifera]|uniref:Protein ELC-like n=1 Tax=Phoenix dactylifera TaxID=42345 RepID=A0A8B7CIF3_PHODC|nr:protein ELC-like [Phoenix dactylifera]
MAPPPPPVPAAPGAQYAQQFLSTALSQRGPAALPYAEDVKWLIRQHLVALAESFPSVHPKASAFTHNDGRTVNLLQADGTIPIVYQGAVYNIPAVIWLLESYPRSPPAVFLSPTRDMVVKPGHPHVDRSGSVLVPYLRSWVFPSSNLVDLVRSLAHIFGLDPPLYTRQNPNNNPTNPNPNPAPSPSPSPAPSPSSSSLSSRIYSSLSPYGGRFPPSPQAAASRPTEDAAEVYRRNATSKIIDVVHGDMAGLRRSREAEIEGLFSTQAELRRREEELSKGLKEMLEEKEGLEQQLQLILMNTDVLEGWLRENEGRRRKAGDVDVDDAFEPADVLSRQMLECTAADLAVEDIIYSLDKAVQEGSIPFDMYLKSVRALSRDQYFHRAMSTKVRAAQVQAQVSSMAARVPHHAS